MKQLYTGTLLLFLTSSVFAANITIVKPTNAIYTSDTVWRFVAASMGHNATLVDDTILDNTFFFTYTDVLITSEYQTNYSITRRSNIEAFLQTGKGAYLQSEYDLSFSGNQAFEAIVSTLGGSFTWTGTVAGVLAPMNVLGTLGTTPITIPPLTYFWYGCNASVCNYFDSFLEFGGQYFGFTFCSPSPGTGRLMTTSDQDWIIQMSSMDLMRNMITHLLLPPANCGLNAQTINLGNDTSLCTGDFLVLGVGISATSWLWSTGATTNVIIVDTSGTFWLEATAGGCSITDTIQVLFSPCSISANFITADPTICPGTCTDFTNASINATSYQWFFPGANPSVSTDVNPTVICYNSPGNYDVTLIATDGLLTDTIIITNCITVYPYPPAQGILQSGDTLFANQGAVTYQWYYDGVLIPGATDYFYVAQASGNFNVVCTDLNGCEVEAVIFDVIAGIEVSSGSNGFQFAIYPNPVNELLNLHLNGTESSGIRIIDALGQEVLCAPVASSTVKIRTSDYSAGIYFLQVYSGNSSHTIRFNVIHQ